MHLVPWDNKKQIQFFLDISSLKKILYKETNVISSDFDSSGSQFTLCTWSMSF